MKSLKASQLKPLAGYVLVEPAEGEKKTASGIILPERDGEKPQYGTVLAVGEPLADDKNQLATGDMVVYKEWGGSKVMIDDKEYQFLKTEDILAIISKK